MDKITPMLIIPTAFEDCLTVEQQLLWLERKVEELSKRLDKLEK